MAKKIIEEEVKTVCTCKKDLIAFLQREMPEMFNRHPDITGDLNVFADKIIEITKC